MSGSYPLQPMGPRQGSVSSQPSGDNTPAPHIKQREISFTALRSLGKELAREHTSTKPVYVDLEEITGIRFPLAGQNDLGLINIVGNVQGAWNAKKSELSQGHAKPNDAVYVEAASQALFIQWEADNLKSKFIEIVDCKLEGRPVPMRVLTPFEEAPKISEFEVEFEKLIDEIYKHAKPERKLLPSDRILDLLLPNYTVKEREKILTYMYKTREVLDAGKIKENLQIFAQSPSSYKLVVVAKDGKKYIEAQKATFLEWFLQFFNVKTTNWDDIFAVLQESKVESSQTASYPTSSGVKELRLIEEEEKNCQRLYKKLVKEHLDLDVMGFEHKDLIESHNDAAQGILERNPKSAFFQEILDLETKLRGFSTRKDAAKRIFNISWNDAVEKNAEYSQKELMSIIEWFFSKP